MLWKGRRGSGNVEDRRGMSAKNVTIGGGLAGIVIAVIVMFLGGDPTEVLQQFQNGQEQTSVPYESNTAEDEMAQFVSVVLADTEEIWTKIFEQNGYIYRKPTLVLFRDQVESACGYASSSSGPFYCSADEKIYIDLSFCDLLESRFGVYGDFAVAYVIAHEVGHHVQQLLGILPQVHEQRQQLSESKANALTVRLELQADFFAGLWAHYAQNMLNVLEQGDLEEALNAAGAVGDDAIQLKTRGRVVPDDFTHGSSEQRMSWFRKGYSTGDISQGDTFSGSI
ncbi:MAG: neutral zinc metallopeptidase [Bacteroidales bacterium]|jgi:predicted metalloprotease|nr:neutral zinc metallopeptidase [Bacteroidales bacterium]